MEKNMDIITILKKDFDKRKAEKKIQWDKDYLKNLEKTKLENMVKPTKPIPPEYKDYLPEETGIKSTLEKPSPFVMALDRYGRELRQYELDLELWEQLKLVKDIQRSNLKLCLKKYLINKK